MLQWALGFEAGQAEWSYGSRCGEQRPVSVGQRKRRARGWREELCGEVMGTKGGLG